MARLTRLAGFKAQIGYNRCAGTYGGKPSLAVDNTLNQQFNILLASYRSHQKRKGKNPASQSTIGSVLKAKIISAGECYGMRFYRRNYNVSGKSENRAIIRSLFKGTHIISTNCDMFSSELFDARKLGIGVYD